MTRSRARAALILLGAWLLAVARPSWRWGPDPFELRSHSALPAAGAQAGEPLGPWAYALLTLGAALAGALLWWLWAGRRRPRHPEEKPERELPPRRWPAAVVALLALAALGGGAWWVWTHAPAEPTSFPLPPPLAAPPAPASSSPTQPGAPPPAPFHPPWAWTAAGLFVALSLLGVALRRQRDQDPECHPPDAPDLDRLAGEAARRLEGGQALEDVVLGCYRQMCEVLSRRCGLGLRREMTAREFATRLQGVGVQDREVSVLTALFEQVRYGGQPAGPQERARAIAALRALERQYRRGQHGA